MDALRSLLGNEAVVVLSPPDEQARAEVEANLNRPPLRNACTDVSDDSDLLNALVEASETLSSFFSVALNLAEELRTEVRELEAAIDYELEKSDFLEQMLQRYASHAWNDIKRELEKL